MMTLAEAELKFRCDDIAGKMLDVLRSEGADLPRSLCVVIAMGAATALAIACRVTRDDAIEMLSVAWREIVEN
jgi:hypothetical protein